MTDAQAYAHTSFFGFLWYALWNFALGIVLLPFALVAVALNIIPLLIIWAIGLLPLSPAVTIISVLLIPLYLVAAIVLSERFVLLWRSWRSWQGNRNLARVGDRLTDERRAVVDAVLAAVPHVPRSIDSPGAG